VDGNWVASITVSQGLIPYEGMMDMARHWASFPVLLLVLVFYQPPK